MSLPHKDLSKAIKDGIIVPDYHAELLDRSAKWTRTAGIFEEDLLLRLSEHCSDIEGNWFKQNKKALSEGVYGLVYVGSFVPHDLSDVGTRMRALTAAFLRNYVDARMRSTEEAFDQKSTVLAISDFGTKPSEYISSRVAHLLVDRAARKRSTIVHVPRLDVIRDWYGESVDGIIQNSYVKVNFHG